MSQLPPATAYPHSGQGQALAELRDIHLPEAVSAWPPGPGWWLLLLLVLALAAGCYVYLRRRQRRPSVASINWRPLFRAELEQIKQQYAEQQNKQQLAMQLSELLRKLVIKENPAANAAGLTGQAWLQALDQHFCYGSVFSESAAAISEAPYNPAIDFNADRLLQLLSDALGRETDETVEGARHAGV